MDNMSLEKRKSNFLNKSKEIHNNKYEYYLEGYINNKTKIDIICPNHGVFKQLPSSHLEGRGCKKCADEKRRINNFSERSKKIHNDKYDYSMVDYINNSTKVKIICKIHGIFEQTPNKHLNGHECLLCSRLNRKSTTVKFINKSKKIHKNKYDYSMVKYIDSHSKINIICKKHGIFRQTPNSHLNGRGCSKCSNNKKMDTKSFIKKSKTIYGDDKFDYSNVNYVNANTKVEIVCKKHGKFYQYPFVFLKKNINCRGCSNISNGENLISEILNNLGIEYKNQYGFNDCRYINSLSFDFYLPEFNSCIEYDGIQHFKPVDFFGGEKSFLKQKEKDNIKNEYCKKNKIDLLRIPYYKIDNIIKIIKEKYAY